MCSDKQSSALPRNDSEIENQLRAKVAAALADPRKSIPVSDVFKRLRALHSEQTKAAD
jgi:hypothetical protein